MSYTDLVLEADKKLTAVLIDSGNVVISKPPGQRVVLSPAQLSAIMAALKSANGAAAVPAIQGSDSSPAMDTGRQISDDLDALMELRSAAAAAVFELGAALGNPRRAGQISMMFDVALALYKRLNDAIDAVDIVGDPV